MMNRKQLKKVFPGALGLLAIFGFAVLIATFDAAVSVAAQGGDSPGPLFAPNDLTGDGRSDFTVARPDGPPSLSRLRGVTDFSARNKVANMQRIAETESPNATGLSWYSASTDGTYLGRQTLGVDTDFTMIADMVGDSKDDLVVWRPPAPRQPSKFSIPAPLPSPPANSADRRMIRQHSVISTATGRPTWSFTATE